MEPGAPSGAAPAAVAVDRPRAEAWALVLASQGISSQLVTADGGTMLLVSEADRSRAEVAVAAYEAENAPRTARPRRVARPRLADAVAAAATAAVLAAIHLLPSAAYRDELREGGSARAAEIIAGEPWRAVTALTLHADAGHLLANIVFVVVFGLALFPSTGAGAGVLVALAGGALANYLNATLRGPPYDGLGASTAVFAGLGALGGMAARSEGRRGSVAVPLLAAAALGALLGTSERTDVMAHALGLATGLAITFVAAPGLVALRPRRAWRLLCAVAATAAVAASWALALLVP